MFKDKQWQDIPKDPFVLVMHFVSLRSSFILRPNLGVKEYYVRQNRAK